MKARFRIERLSADHDRAAFQCGVQPLDRYFREQVTQDIRRRVTTCFVALEQGSENLAGYYTLASSSASLSDLPPETSKRLPRYPLVPAVRMGRLAVARAYAGQGLGSALLADALRRALTAEIAAYALIVDAKDEAAAAFYRHHGFIAFAGRPRMLFLPLDTARHLLP